MSNSDHSKILSSIFFVFGVFDLIIWILFGGLFSGQFMPLVFSAVYILAAINIQNQRPNAKVFGIIASLISLLSFPIGTAVGIYGMWYFLYAEKKIY